MSILNKILQTKHREVDLLKNKQLPKGPIKEKPTFQGIARKSQNVNIIAEIKRASPSKGVLSQDVDPVKLAKFYESFGASAISVLTDETYFKGSFADLKNVSHAVKIPVLCKDFIIDKIQIDFAKAAGAQIILLIVAALSDDKLHRLYGYAKQLDLEVLVEVHDAVDLKRALKLNANIIGINNRNLKTFTVDLNTTNELIRQITYENKIIVSESGLKTRNDVERVAKAGAHAILVGETFMTTDDLKGTFSNLTVPLPDKRERFL